MSRFSRALSKHRLALAVKVACLLGLVVGCATAPPPESTVEEPAIEEARSASDLMRRARGAPEDRAARLYLNAAEEYLAVEDVAGARAAFDLVEPGLLDDARLADYRLVSARLALAEGDPALASDILSRLPRKALDSPEAARLKSEVCAATGDYPCALSELVRVAGDDPAENERIWQWLNASSTLSAGSGAARPVSRVLSAWQDLHHALVTAESLEDAKRRATAWIAGNPGHPGSVLPPDAVAAIAAYRPARFHVGLVVPLSGPLARAGEAVRDGFIATTLLAGAGGRVDLTIYDAAAEPIPVIYERVLSDRVDLLVGPLQKDTVVALNELNPEIPTLVLNYLDHGTRPAPGLQQVGLAIEDEALTIAARLRADGVHQALLFHNYEDWSLRARNTLIEKAEAGGAMQLTVQPFTDLRTVTEAVGSAMHVAESQARRDQLASTLGVPLEFTPRGREDVDAVVALIGNSEANALVPALNFHFAQNLPVYAGSQVTRGSRQGLNELRGFHVSELPFFLDGDGFHGSMATPLALDRNPFASLVALGSDAFRLTERIQLGSALGDLPLLGSSGLLRRLPDGRISRELAWGTISTRGVVAEAGARL
ncbi:MAG: penicillin-binding protein activator [Pseudomonadales bacterium]